MARSRRTAEIQLLHGRVWLAIVRKAAGQSQIDAAISYISIAPSFLKKRDRVACNFSIGCTSLSAPGRYCNAYKPNLCSTHWGSMYRP